MQSAIDNLRHWNAIDTWIVVIGSLAAMACALPGNFLVLRRQSLMGDAISHTSLLGVVAGFLAAHSLMKLGLISPTTEPLIRHIAMCVGAILVGVLAAWLTESLQKLGNMESSAALGVVFTSLFALGLLLIRAIADDVHIDPDCVLYGSIESAPLETAWRKGPPRAVIVNGVVLGFNLLLVLLLFKELRLSAFDPALATTLGIPSGVMHYGLMGLTAMTLVTAFESVGSILVIAMLIVPPATAYLLTDRLPVMIGLSLLVAVLSALLGHVSALSLPPLIAEWFGVKGVHDASTAGMMAAAAGGLFVLAMMFGPRNGMLSRVWSQALLKRRIAGEDVLGRLFRSEELRHADVSAAKLAAAPPTFWRRWALWDLHRRGLVAGAESDLSLTDIGRDVARNLVRSHRLWESYLSKHFVLGEGRFHESAEQIEHFLDGELLAELDHELDRPGVDPHGRAIPGS